MKRFIVVLLLMAIPCLAAPTWRIAVKVEKTPADTTEERLKIHNARHDSLQADTWAILQDAGIEGWAICDNSGGTSFAFTTPDTLLIMKLVRSLVDKEGKTEYAGTTPDSAGKLIPRALGKYNQGVVIKKTRVD